MSRSVSLLLCVTMAAAAASAQTELGAANLGKSLVRLTGSEVVRLRRRHLSPPASRLPNRFSALADPAAEEALIELLAQLYAHTRLLQMKLRQQLLAEAEVLTNEAHKVEFKSGSEWLGAKEEEAEERRRMKMRLLGLDEQSLGAWLEERQRANGHLRGLKFELLNEPPNRSINICPDGPKILVVLPNVSDFLYCYTRDQWLEKLWLDLRPNYQQHYPIILLNFLIFLVGATGNVFVCLSVYRNHQLRNVTNYFIVNLAFADLLVIIICLPATLTWDLTLTWFFGTYACKLVMFLQDVSISVSVLTLTAISLDRYYAICHPLKFKSSLGQAKRAILAIWLVSLLIMSPDLVYLAARESQELAAAGLETVLYSDCNYDWSPRASRAFQFIKTILLYLVPFMLMFAAHYTIMRTLRAACAISLARAPVYYSSSSARPEPTPIVIRRPEVEEDQVPLRSLAPERPASIMVTMHNRGQLEARRKAAKMLTAIVVIFGLCYLPVHLINFLRQFIDDIPQTDVASTLAMLAHCLCYLNSAINPIIYNHMNSIFRAEFKQFLSSCLCCFGSPAKRPLDASRSASQRTPRCPSHLSASRRRSSAQPEGAARTTSNQSEVIELGGA